MVRTVGATRLLFAARETSKFVCGLLLVRHLNWLREIKTYLAVGLGLVREQEHVALIFIHSFLTMLRVALSAVLQRGRRHHVYH